MLDTKEYCVKEKGEGSTDFWLGITKSLGIDTYPKDFSLISIAQFHVHLFINLLECLDLHPYGSSHCINGASQLEVIFWQKRPPWPSYLSTIVFTHFLSHELFTFTLHLVHLFLLGKYVGCGDFRVTSQLSK